MDNYTEIRNTYIRLEMDIWQRTEALGETFKTERDVSEKVILCEKLKALHKIQTKMNTSLKPCLLKIEAEARYLVIVQQTSSKTLLKQITKLETLLDYYRQQMNLIYTPTIG